jgi:hypothetical protein
MDTTLTSVRTGTYRLSSARAGQIIVVAAVIGFVSGLVTAFIPPQVGLDRASYPYTPGWHSFAHAVFALNHVLLAIGLIALARHGGRLGRAGAWIAVLGMALLAICELGGIALRDSAYPTSQTDLWESSYGLPSVLIGLGTILAGVGIVRAGVWRGWERWTVLTFGIALFVLVLPGVFGSFLAGRLVLIVWMVIAAFVGIALTRQRD